MIAAVITLAGSLGVAIIAIIALAYFARDAMNDARAAFGAEVIAIRNQLLVEMERDGLKARLAKAEAERDAANQRCQTAERAANRARQELVNRVSNEVVSASPGDVVAIVDGLLSQPPPIVSTGNPSPARR